ncbi:ATG16 autophagy related 16-like 2 isoform X3 [Gouania willdenowi]|uniref:ATG16 autophagy related 16-like 2 isoform X3 n=1 Tax=Gouania willdenowi TaxID=441366 RepID=UPI0010551DEC|nr:autophagy-related protein 16-2-like isoform X3 [Gouania willdenowi]
MWEQEAGTRRRRAVNMEERSVAQGPQKARGEGGSGSWRDHVLLELRLRDLRHQQHGDMIRAYIRLLEKISVTSDPLSGFTSSSCFLNFLSAACPWPRPHSAACWTLPALHQYTQLSRSSAELAYQIIELQRLFHFKQREEKEKQGRLEEKELLLQGALDARRALQERVEQLQEENEELKKKYDALLQCQRSAELQMRAEKERKAELQTMSQVTVHSCDDSADQPRRLFRRMFDRKRRVHSDCTEDLLFAPVGVALSVRLPVKPLHELEAHNQGINAVKFSSSADLLATGGTDRVVKLWNVGAGVLTNRVNLTGSTGGITCLQFDQSGSRILAASYDTSALLWSLDDCNPKVTLTGHNRKVTAARFAGSHQAVTGATDRTIRLWDLNRVACVQKLQLESSCSDLVCGGGVTISGHYDCKIRVWDSRVESCVQELPAQGKVTCLDLSLDELKLLSCCRDNCLQVVDLRGRSYEQLCLRAEGFKCSDSTKAVLSPDGCYVAAGSADGAVYIWTLSSGTLETRLLDRHSCPVSAVGWSPSGAFVVSVDRSGRAVLWSDF